MAVSLILRLLFLSHVLSLCIGEDTASTKTCESNNNCESCISAHHQCSWRSGHPKVEKDVPKSENVTACLNSSGDSSEKIENPSSHSIYERNDEFTKQGESTDAGRKLVQIKPQVVTVKLRNGQATKVNITYKKVVNFPLDIYFAMDLSASMSDDLETLQKIGADLFDDVKKKITDNVHIGFGSFVDKVLNPFTNTDSKWLENPCLAQKRSCAPPFGFRHQLKITGNSSEFAETINNTRTSGNIDKPEGAFDALMQIAVCKQIGWRNESTHMVILSTDAVPHFAMDGKMAAILEANDMKCNLEKGVHDSYPEDMVYAKSETMDYPSLGQLREVFRRNGIKLVFAVTEDVHSLYEGIESFLSDAYVVKLDSDSKNIIDELAKTYANKIRGSLSASVTEPPTGVRMEHRVFCPSRGPYEGGEIKCDGVNKGSQVVFEFEFTTNQCPGLKKSNVVFSSDSWRNEEVIINLECVKCDCESRPEFNSSQCSNNGSLTCGICHCEEGREGTNCERIKSPESCKDPRSNSTCNGNGNCVYGECECIDPYVGSFCDCQSIGCPAVKSELCGGPEKGLCRNCDDDKEKCVCFPPYSIRPSDKTCSCHPSFCTKNHTSSNVACSGRGECDCDSCVCNEAEVWSGKYCDTCIHPTCTGLDMSCEGEAINDCVKCKTEENKDDDCRGLCTFNVSVIFSIDDKILNCENCTDDIPACGDCEKHSSLKSDICMKYHMNKDNTNCSYQYQVVWTTQNQFNVYMTKHVCPETDLLTIILPIISSAVIVLICSIVAWSLWTRRQDKLQVEAFKKEVLSGRWDCRATALYKEPIQKTTNPAFAGDGMVD